MNWSRLGGIAMCGAFLLWGLDVRAADSVPPSVQLSGVLRNVAGEPVTGSHFVTFRIFATGTCTASPVDESAVDGSCLLGLESQTVDVVNGRFTVRLTANKAWAIDRSLLFVEVAADGVHQGRKAFTSTGYVLQAEHAEEADQAAAVTCVGCVVAANVGAGAVDDSHIAANAAIQPDKINGISPTLHSHAGKYIYSSPVAGSEQGADIDILQAITASKLVDVNNTAAFVDPADLGHAAALAGQVRIGSQTVPPAGTLLSVGSSGQFRVSTAGDVAIRGQAYVWPDPTGAPAAGMVLTNDGNNNLSWATTSLGTLPAGEGLVVVTGTAGTYQLRSLAGTNYQVDVANGTGTAGNPTMTLATDADLPGTLDVQFPVGGTPSTTCAVGVTGMVRFNNVLNRLEYCDGSSWEQVGTSGDLLSNMPVGTIMAFAGVNAPAGWEVCNGTSLNRASNPELFTAIGSTWGALTGSEFSLPDMQAEYLRGLDATGAVDPDSLTRYAKVAGGNAGRNVGSYQDSKNLEHTHLAALNPLQARANAAGQQVCFPAGTSWQDGAPVSMPGIGQFAGGSAGTMPLIGVPGSDSTVLAGPSANFGMVPRPGPTGSLAFAQVYPAGSEEVPASGTVLYIIKARSCVNGVCPSNCGVAGWDNCDGVAENGCETSLRTADNCGSCNSACVAKANVDKQHCLDGSCAIANCTAWFSDCNTTYGDGCEANLQIAENSGSLTRYCGSCGRRCWFDYATASCPSGACTYTGCDADHGNCNGLIGDGVSSHEGCETTIWSSTAAASITNCATCGSTCTKANSTVTCPKPAGCTWNACNAGYATCGAVAQNVGCPINLLGDLSNCGTCGAVCGTANNVPQCVNGTCNLNCNALWGSCDNLNANGCEATLQNASAAASISNCGSCGSTCTYPQANVTCPSGSCTLSSCLANWMNCDGAVANGCEANITTNTSHCGGCNAACGLSNASWAGCAASKCSYTCNTGYADCVQTAWNGCETSTRTTANCNGCGVVCPPAGSAAAYGNYDCGGGTCTLASCNNASYASCDGTTGAGGNNGCETAIYGFGTPDYGSGEADVSIQNYLACTADGTQSAFSVGGWGERDYTYVFVDTSNFWCQGNGLRMGWTLTGGTDYYVQVYDTSIGWISGGARSGTYTWSDTAGSDESHRYYFYVRLANKSGVNVNGCPANAWTLSVTRK
jgi:microcystin-dependent protein